jgi:hypothetical protein
MTVSVQVTRDQVADTENSYDDTDSNKYAASMKERAAV